MVFEGIFSDFLGGYGSSTASFEMFRRRFGPSIGRGRCIFSRLVCHGGSWHDPLRPSAAGGMSAEIWLATRENGYKRSLKQHILDLK